MSTILSHVKLVVLRPTGADEKLVTKWSENLQANAERLNENRKQTISDEDLFQALIAAESHQTWTPFVNPTFHSKSGQDSTEIKGSHYANLKEAFELYNRKLDDVFAEVDGIPAKRFKDAVERAKGDFSRGIAKRTLPFTGDRRAGRGPAAIAAYWLIGDTRAEQYLRGGDDVLQGGPFRVARTDLGPAFKAALTGRIIQAGANIIKMERDPVEMTRQNDLMNSLVHGFVDPALGLESFATGGTSHVDFIIDNDELYLDIQVSAV